MLKERLEKKFPLARSIDAGDLIELFLVSAVFSILSIRLILEIYNYPIIGAGYIHIAHLMWGGLLMMLALFNSFIFLNKDSKKVSAVIGGLGFGYFIDEVGKFITNDNNYFYEPAVSLIYITLVFIYLLSRFLDTKIVYSQKEYAINAMEEAKDIFLHDFDQNQKAKALIMLQKSALATKEAEAIKTLIAQFEAHQKNLSLFWKFKNYVRKLYLTIIKNPKFSKSLITFFILFSLINFVSFAFRIGAKNNLMENLGLISSFTASIFVVYGILMVKRKKMVKAYKSFKIAVLLSVFLSQFFNFYERQFLALFGLVANIVIYSSLNYLISEAD